jgi:hypothetical protein
MGWHGALWSLRSGHGASSATGLPERPTGYARGHPAGTPAPCPAPAARDERACHRRPGRGRPVYRSSGADRGDCPDVQGHRSRLAGGDGNSPLADQRRRSRTRSTLPCTSRVQEDRRQDDPARRVNGAQWHGSLEVDFGPLILDGSEWWAHAACRGSSTLFYRGDRVSQATAVAVCRGCPVRVDCEAETRRVEGSGRRSGVRAGFTPQERRGW